MNLIHLFTISLFVLNFSGRKPPFEITTRDSLSIVSKVKVIHDKETEEYIPWSTERPLSWDDYLCEPVRNTDAVASTSTSLGISYQVVNSRLVYHISCGFSKTKSWKLVHTDYILAHEQGHFDITEIFARKLYQGLQNYNFNRRSFKRDINEIYQAIVNEKEDFQQMYDGESDHSRNRKIQYEWLDKIQKMLNETEAYANYP